MYTEKTKGMPPGYSLDDFFDEKEMSEIRSSHSGSDYCDVCHKYAVDKNGDCHHCLSFDPYS